MDCHSCGEGLPPGAAFCHRCGARQEQAPCGGCGAELIVGAAFCSSCGTPVPGGPAEDATPPSRPVAERRLTSVLFADLVSYTTLSEKRDTEEVRELLSAYFDTCSTVVRRYGGVVEKFIGDAVMAVWGVPTTYEDDAERAVRAGLELVEQVTSLGERLAIPDLALRVGIVTGEVAATLGATDQGMVAGDPVNTAARVQSKAGAGEVWVDATTRSLTSAAITFTDTGEHELKGKEEPVRLFAAGTVVAGVGGLSRVDGLEAPLVGRDRELRLLKELLHACEESGRPHLVVVDGEGGIGKSRLAWELEKYVDGLTTSFAWHRGRCLSYGDGVAFWALAEAVRSRVGAVGTETGAMAGLDALLDELTDEASERAWLRPRVASLLGEESREFPREDLFAAWTRFFERVAAGGPLVLVVDDAQHMDDGLADFVDFLVTRAVFPCFVVLLARPELLAHRPHVGGRRTTPVRLEPLSADAMGLLVDGLVDGLPGSLRQALVQRSGGIPLYAVETVRALIDRDAVVPREGRYVVADDVDLDLSTLGPPASLHALVAARLDALDQVERRVLSDASVLGEAFTREGVGILCHDVPDLDAVLSRLEHKQLVAIDVDRFSAERGQYRFLQTIVRQVAYGTLSRRDRRSRHLAVAEHLQEETERVEELAQVIAQHLLDAAEVTEGGESSGLRIRAGELLDRAGERAFALGAYADAVRSWTAALDCLGGAAARGHVLRRQTEALIRTNRYDEAVETGTESVRLLEEAGRPIEAAEAAYYLGTAYVGVEREGDARRLGEQQLEALSTVTEVDGAELARVRRMHLAGVAGTLVFSGRASEATPHLMEALHLSNRVEDPPTFTALLNVVANQQSHEGSWWLARLILRAMADLGRENEDWQALTVALVNLGVHQAPIDIEQTIASMLEARRNAVDHGLGVHETIHANLLNYGFAAGRWDLVREVLAEVIASPVRVRLSEFAAAGATGRLRWAGAAVPSDVELPDREYGGVYRGVGQFSAGSVALADGASDRAVELLSEAVSEELDRADLLDDFAVFWPVAVFAAAELDGPLPEGLVALVPRVLDGVGSSWALRGLARVVRALAGVRAEDPGDARGIETDLREGAAHLEGCGMHVWAALTREHLGRWLLDRADTEAATLELDAALAAYESFGASAWAQRVRELTAAAVGAGPLQ